MDLPRISRWDSLCLPSIGLAGHDVRRGKQDSQQQAASAGTLLRTAAGAITLRQCRSRPEGTPPENPENFAQRASTLGVS